MGNIFWVQRPFVYFPREKGGRVLCSVENEYKLTMIKAAIKLYRNTDPTIQLVRDYEERAVDQGHQSLIKEATKYANEIGITVHLNHPHVTSEVEYQFRADFLKSRWDDEKPNQAGCFARLNGWKHAPSHSIAGVMELNEQLTPTKLYNSHNADDSDL